MFHRAYFWEILREKPSLTKYICQPEDEDRGTPECPRLKLRERDRDFFEEYSLFK